MLFKILIIGGLAFYLFRLMSGPGLKQGQSQDPIRGKEEYTDYEEVD